LKKKHDPQPTCRPLPRLFNVTPPGEFFGLAINGRQVAFSENVFYTFVDGKIAQVWSVTDKAAIEQQLAV
jgi:predicted ester cyclase